MISKIDRNTSLENGYYHLIIQAPEITSKARPGQFIMVRVANNTSDPLLRRPISIMDIHTDGTLEMLYKVVGKGTHLLSTFRSGDELDVIGPLGNGFQSLDCDHVALLVGGGVGMPPLLFLARYLLNRNCGKVIAFMGARAKSDLPVINRFKELGMTVYTATEAGDCGTKGLVTKPLVEYLQDVSVEEKVVLYACGPDAMLKAISRISVEYKLLAQLSLEEHMACGVGACLGCVVKTRDGFLRVCKDGPVFYSDMLKKWE